MSSVASMLFVLSAEQKTGTLVVAAGGSVGRVTLDGGWVHALANVGPRRERGEEMLAAFLRAIGTEIDARFEAPPASASWGRVTPFHPARTLRLYIDERLPPSFPHPRLGKARVRLRTPPHASCLERDEITLVQLLAAPRTLDELVATRVSLPARVERLLLFLDAAGVLEAPSAGLAAAYAELGLEVGVGIEEARRTYHRLARTLHPDLRPEATRDERRSLEARLQKLTAAYEIITG